MNLNVGLNNLWPTPVYKTEIDKVECSQLLTDIMLVESIATPNDNVKSNLIHEVPLLKRLAEEKFSEYLSVAYNKNLSDFEHSFRGWLTGSKKGYNMDIHNHSGAQFTSVFYLVADPNDDGGEMILKDPRHNANRGFTPSFQNEFNQAEFSPNSGDVLIFPGYVYHFVKRFNANLRLAVPVDIYIKE